MIFRKRHRQCFTDTLHGMVMPPEKGITVWSYASWSVVYQVKIKAD